MNTELEELLTALQLSRIWLDVYMSEFDPYTPVLLKQVDDAIVSAKKLIKEESN